MPLPLICTCGARFRVDETFAEREVICPECRTHLHAPPAGDPVVRVSKLALLSFVLALVGAFTVVGTALAAVLGLAACARILGNPHRAGLPYAVAGVVLGVALTAGTLAALSGDYLRGLRTFYREALLADQLEPTADLEVRRGDKGFLIRRPDAAWGVARQSKIDDDFVMALRVNRTPEVLLVQPALALFVDVRRDTIPADVALWTVQNAYFDRLRKKAEPPDDPWGRRWGPRDMMLKDAGPQWQPEDAEEAFDPSKPAPPTVESVWQGNEAALTVLNEKGKAPANAAGKEVAADVTFANKRGWKLLVRFYRVGDVTYVVRGYARAANFAAGEAELRRVLDSFRVVP